MAQKENGAIPDMRAADKPDKEMSAELGIEVSARKVCVYWQKKAWYSEMRKVAREFF